jgi:MOSC domain-containing protein YiiM
VKLEARIESLFVGRAGLEKQPEESIEVNFDGIVGDKHAGFTKPADSRNTEYRRGTEMRNDRQWSAVSSEELEVISERMGVPHIEPGWIGANLALSGIPNLTELPKGTKLVFPKDAVLLVEGENLPCVEPGEVIQSKYPDLKVNGKYFPRAARGRRGLVGVVERPGFINLQDKVTVKVYQPKLYSLPSNIRT